MRLDLPEDMPSDEDAGVLEWEAIPDDVLVPRRTKRRRHRFREGFAPDVLLVGQTRRVRARVGVGDSRRVR